LGCIVSAFSKSGVRPGTSCEIGVETRLAEVEEADDPLYGGLGSLSSLAIFEIRIVMQDQRL
jgi:hypothetical protein